jgi:Flp pilus assembly protein TadB
VSAAGGLPLGVTLVVLFAAIFALAALVLAAAYPDPRARRARRMLTSIEWYGSQRPATAGGGPLARVADGLVAPLLRVGGLEQRIGERLDLAGSARRPAEWVLLGGCPSAACAVLLLLLRVGPLVAIAIGALFGWLAMRFVLSLRISRRRAAFSDQLPDVLQFIAGTLHSGFSLAQGLDAVVREDAQPAASEFSRAMVRSQIGMTLEDALDAVADRMESADLRWTVIAIKTQREVGGNLAEVLGQTVETMRERASIRREVRALSAEGRLSAYILIALPILIAGYLFLVSPVYLSLLYTTGVGLGMLAATAVLMVIGSLWMRKVVKVEV